MPYPHTIHVPHTLSFMANIGRDKALGTHIRGFVAEFDCSIDVEYSEPADYEIASVTFEQTRFDAEFTVTPKTDPELWAIIKRAFDYDWKGLEAKIAEMIHADIGDRKDDVADQRYEDMRDRHLEMGR